jgi:two-component system chemotaxis sensor kinase CheA
VVAGIGGAPELQARLLEWKHEPFGRMLSPLARDAQRISNRLGKNDLKVVIRDGRMMLPRPPWCGLIAALSHAVRNAVDHGIESPQERLSAGKPEQGTLVLSAELRTDGHVCLKVSDDGRGINWERLKLRAASDGLPTETHAHLVEALFSDGVTTRDEGSDLSGCGVGLGALRAECLRLGRVIDVTSTAGVGTELTVIVPVHREPG